MSAELAKVFYNSAKDELNKEHLDKAFKNVYEGYKLDPLNTDIANAIVYMERQANDLLNTQPSCETYGYALSITRPESPPHKKAADAAHKAHCPGLE
jgi:hypothetical protein